MGIPIWLGGLGEKMVEEGLNYLMFDIHYGIILFQQRNHSIEFHHAWKS
jgi:hypothetical protein